MRSSHHIFLRLAALATLAASTTSAAAQGTPTGTPPGTPRGAPPAGMPNPAGPARAAGGEIRGRIVIAGAAQAVTSGSVTVLRGSANSFAGGALPRPDGSFVVEGLQPGTYTVRIRAMGYAPVVRTDVAVSPARPSVDLGVVELTTVATTLERQTVTAEAAAQQLSPERNSYSVKQMATASGGTAIDALRNVPAIEVDGSNVVSLRGNSNVVIQINGRTSPLRGEQLGNFLAQLPAQTVSNIEVVTSPSAKDDPEGTAGIINLVLSQPTQATTSGGTTVATGTTGLANVSANVGKQTDKWTLFASGGGFHDARPMDGHADRTLLGGSTTSFSNSRIDGRMRPLSGNLMLRSEWKRNRTDALSFDVMGNMGDFRRENESRFATLDDARDTTSSWVQLNDGGQHNFVQDYSLAYRRIAPPNQPAPTFTTLLRFTQFAMHFQSLRANELLMAGPDGSTAPPTERNGLRVRFPTWTLQGDYAKPFGPATKVEGGVKSTLRTLNSRAEAATFDDGTETFEPIAGRNYGLRYDEAIQAAYGTLSRRVGKAQLQGGVRAEQTNTRLELPALDAPSERDYLSLFPNAFALYNLTDMRSVRLGYSRRITRPDAPQLDPSPFYEDARTVFRGNPMLRPEYTNAFELTLQDGRSWGSVQVNPYVRMSDDAVRNIRTVTPEGLTVSTFSNVASTTSIGTDVNTNIRRGAMTLGLGGGAFHYESEADSLSTKTFGWNARTNLGLKLGRIYDVQVMANYRAAQKVEGGTLLPFLMTNFALRQKLWGEQGSVTLRVADPFNLAKFATRVSNGVVIEESQRRFGMRGVFVSFQRNFGQAIRLRPPVADPNAAPQGGLPGGPPGGGA
jgi:ferric enterobactin receptor